ncbi:MAG: AraC family transcriptional regulator [Sandaracinus sp.]
MAIEEPPARPRSPAASTAAAHVEIAPAPRLAAHVDRFWARTSPPATGAPHRVLPDGCVDLLVDLEAGSAELVGPMSRAVVVPDGTAKIAAVRFRPGAGAGFAGVPLEQLVDRSVPVAELGIEARPLVDALARERGALGLAATLARFVERRLAEAEPTDRRVRHAVARLVHERRPRVASLAEELGVSRQYLARLFAREVGVGPKVLARSARMQRAVLAVRRGRRDWPGLAQELGLVDQAHLVNELTELVGLTPARLAEEVSISPIASLYDATESPP